MATLPITSTHYAVEQIAPNVYAIDDIADESMYLVVGSERALLIDTGMDSVSPMTVVRQLTDKPVVLALTHAHPDHMMFADEFDTVYLSKEEKLAFNTSLLPLRNMRDEDPMAGKSFAVEAWTPLLENEVIDLGDKKIRMIMAEGHTPGSCLFADDENALLFTGDAFGSGCGAWMWLPGCSTVKEYLASLQRVLKQFENKRNYRMLGGHRRQSIPSDKNPVAFPLDFALVENMALMCEQMLNGTLEPEKESEQWGHHIFFYAVGSAGAWFTKQQIR